MGNVEQFLLCLLGPEISAQDCAVGSDVGS